MFDAVPRTGPNSATFPPTLATAAASPVSRAVKVLAVTLDLDEPEAARVLAWQARRRALSVLQLATEITAGSSPRSWTGSPHRWST